MRVTLEEPLYRSGSKSYCWFCGQYAPRETKHLHFASLESFLEWSDTKRKQATISKQNSKGLN
jgi:hypothetical protein